MPRHLRIQYEGAIYHLMSRGDRREEIFRDDLDRKRFLQALGAACERIGWQVHAYCLMGNHFHLVVETPRANLVEGMKWLLGTYTMRFNRRHQHWDHLFGGRYKAQLIDELSPGYLVTAANYVHLNPVRAGLLGEIGNRGQASILDRRRLELVIDTFSYDARGRFEKITPTGGCTTLQYYYDSVSNETQRMYVYSGVNQITSGTA